MRRTRPHRNRVTPFSEIVAIELRGAWTGNRGILHRDGGGTEIVRHHAGIAWITCLLEPAERARPPINTAGTAPGRSGAREVRLPGAFPARGRRIPQWTPGHYTPLFFHDEAVAFAAGHRPCAECRRPAFRAFLDALTTGRSDGPEMPSPAPTRAPDLDRLLDDQRRFPRTSRRRLHDRSWRDLPDGTFVGLDDAPAVVVGDALVEWSTLGYRTARARPTIGRANVLTPPATVAALAAGYPVQIDPSARLVTQTRCRTEDSSSATDE